MKTILISTVLLLGSAVVAAAEGITISDAYARSGSKSGAAFFTISNAGEAADRLLGVRSEVARRTELHTHILNDQGVMRMIHVEEGLEIPAGGAHALARGGDHVMLMGLAEPLEQGSTITLTLEFELAGEIAVDMPVDNHRKATHKHNH